MNLRVFDAPQSRVSLMYVKGCLTAREFSRFAANPATRTECRRGTAGIRGGKNGLQRGRRCRAKRAGPPVTFTVTGRPVLTRINAGGREWGNMPESTAPQALAATRAGPKWTPMPSCDPPSFHPPPPGARAAGPPEARIASSRRQGVSMADAPTSRRLIAALGDPARFGGGAGASSISRRTSRTCC